MRATEQDKTNEDETTSPPEERFMAEVPPPPEPNRWRGLPLVGALLVALMIVVGVVFAAAGGDEASAPAAAPKPAPAASKTVLAPAPAARVRVTLKEFTISPAPAVGRAGKVTFRVRNAGAIRHEFVVLRTKKPAAKLLKGREASEAGNVGEIGDLKPGATKTLRLNLRAGHYALICNLSGHYVAGQHADFFVK
jgi:uncharacterized cupredoxin-like copper-binding protein